MTLCFDLDGTLCTDEHGDYQKCQPFVERIAKVNQLKKAGAWIIIDTARNETHYVLTKRQLFRWGLDYNELRIGEKPFADRYIDDRSVHPDKYFEDEEL